MALFESGMARFELQPAATLGDLADRLARLGERHDGALLRIDVKLPPRLKHPHALVLVWSTP